LTTQSSWNNRDMTSDESTRLESGAFVEVRNRFDGAWCPGFQIDRAVADGYIVRRCPEGAVLP
jgi:hypothetical protein